MDGPIGAAASLAARRAYHLAGLFHVWNYAEALYRDDVATLDDLREAVTTLEETERTARRVLGGAHPLTSAIEYELRDARSVLDARETPLGGA